MTQKSSLNADVIFMIKNILNDKKIKKRNCNILKNLKSIKN